MNLNELKKMTPEELALEKKEWSELTDQEKIERMRKIVKDSTMYSNRRIMELERKLRRITRHDHKDGKMIIEYSDYDENNCCGEAASSRNYF